MLKRKLLAEGQNNNKVSLSCRICFKCSCCGTICGQGDESETVTNLLISHLSASCLHRVLNLKLPEENTRNQSVALALPDNRGIF